jgi:hypothetical protein
MSDGQSGCANEQREIIRGIDNTPTRRVIISFGRKECKNYALSDDLGPGSKRGAINEPGLSRCGLFGIYRDRSIDREGAEPPVDYAQPPVRRLLGHRAAVGQITQRGSRQHLCFPE